MRLAVLSALFVLVLGVGLAAAQTPDTTGYPPVTTALDPNAAAAGAGQTQGLPRTGSSSSVPTAAIAVGMVAVGSALAIGARRRHAARRPLS
jgi:LPXTG-motif cell wall-anchored protein